MKRRYIQPAIITVFWSLLIIYVFHGIFKISLSFDSAMNFQISESLVETGLYASRYTELAYPEALFYLPVQTGAPVILPTAVLNFLFGAKPIHMQIVTTMYLVGVLILSFLVIKKYSNPYWACFAMFSILFITDVLWLTWGSLGEISMGFWMLLSFVLYQKGRELKKPIYFFFVGIALGLGYLTKTAFLICIPSFFVFIAYDLIKSKLKEILNYIKILGGTLLPIAVFEVYKFILLGKDRYLARWKEEVGSVIFQTGVSSVEPTNTVNFFQKCYSRLIMVKQAFLMENYYAVIIFGLIPTIYFIYYYFVKKERKSLALQCYIMTVGYVMWWCMLIPESKLWLRRIQVGIVLGMIVALIAVGEFIVNLIKKHQPKWKLISYSIVMILIVAIMIQNVLNNVSFYKMRMNGGISQKKSSDTVISYINEMPDDAILMGVSWWQAPVIAAESGRVIENLEYHAGDTDEFYFIEDYYMNNALGPGGVKNYLSAAYRYELVCDGGYDRIYKAEKYSADDIYLSGNYLEIKLAVPFYSSCSLYTDTGNGFSEECRYYYWQTEEKRILFKIDEQDVDMVMLSVPIRQLQIESIEYCSNGTKMYWDGEEMLNIIQQKDKASIHNDVVIFDVDSEQMLLTILIGDENE